MKFDKVKNRIEGQKGRLPGVKIRDPHTQNDLSFYEYPGPDVRAGTFLNLALKASEQRAVLVIDPGTQPIQEQQAEYQITLTETELADLLTVIGKVSGSVPPYFQALYGQGRGMLGGVHKIGELKTIHACDDLVVTKVQKPTGYNNFLS